MRDVEILAYAPSISMRDFIEYVKDEVLDANGNTAKDKQDRFITGIIPWLHGREIPEAHFFSSNPDNEVIKVFVATMRPPENEELPVPWMRDVPGLEERVRVDGVIGETPDFGSSIPGGMSTPLDFVVPRPDLDDLFNTVRDNIARIDFDKVSFTKQALLDALQGKKGTNLRQLLSEVQSTQNLDIMKHRLKPTR